MARLVSHLISAARPRVIGALVAPVALAALMLTSLGCTGRFTVPPEPDEERTVRPQCADVGSRLTITQGDARVGAGQTLALSGSGGTGNYRWRILTTDPDMGSGAAVDPRFGLYVAGAPQPELEDTVDVVVLEDSGCVGDASISITVVAAPFVIPSAVSLAPGGRIAFEGNGGSGVYTWTLSTNVSGASIDDSGNYVAGSGEGRDVVRLIDVELGAEADAVVDVRVGASLALEPDRWVVPLGSTIALPTRDGSGEYEVTANAAAVAIEGLDILAVAAGEATLTVRDRFTGEMATMSVRVVAPVDAERRFPGDRSENHQVAPPVDVDGDGWLDVVVGLPDASGDWYQSGLVVVFAGTESGIETQPSRVLSGSFRDSEFGTALDIGDVDADGRPDLLIGARREDPTRTDVGAVFVYSGVEGQFFSDEPTRLFVGAGGFDLFGESIATCDFNGDGLLDIAIGAPYAQTTNTVPDQGIVSVFLAYSEGRFVSSPDVTLEGQLLMGGVMVAHERMRLGEELAAGDYDGDGVCDLAVTALEATPEQLDTGAVMLFRGVALEGPDRGGPMTVPSLIWGLADGSDDNGRFGRSLGLADIDGDSLADLFATRNTFDGAEGGDTGALYVRFGRMLSGPATEITDIPAGADWSVEGLGSSDRRGHDAVLADLDGDGLFDIVSGDSRAGIEDSELSRPGVVSVFRGASGGPGATADRLIEGVRAGDRFGMGVGAVGDLDGDGASEIVAVAPYYDATEGEEDDRGGVFVAPSGGGAPIELEVPWPISGGRAGQSVAWVELNGDTTPELVVGNALGDRTGLGRNVGMVTIHPGGAGGPAAAPAQTLVGFTGHSDSDEFGWQVAGAGDFDGDGRGDLAVLARSEDLAENPDETLYELGPGCAAAPVRNTSAAVLVFLGNGDGTVGSEPAFVLYGAEAGDRISSMVADLDVNGDGLSDVVIGSREWDAGADNGGGARVFLGRAPSADGRILLACDADIAIDGDTDGMRLGHSVAALGDIDGDGCADFAAGAPESDPLEVSNAGEVLVFFGFDATRCGTSTALRTARFRGTVSNQQLGTSMAGGVDTDGDGASELLIGAERFRDGRGEIGRVYLVRGSALSAGAGATANLPSAAARIWDGASAGERLGSSVAIARLPDGGSVALLGGPFGASAGRVDTGGAVLVAIDGSANFGEVRMQVSGDARGRSSLGDAVALRRAGTRLFVAVGAPFSSAVGPDDGAAYAFTF